MHPTYKKSLNIYKTIYYRQNNYVLLCSTKHILKVYLAWKSHVYDRFELHITSSESDSITFQTRHSHTLISHKLWNCVVSASWYLLAFTKSLNMVTGSLLTLYLPVWQKYTGTLAREITLYLVAFSPEDTPSLVCVYVTY